ncbi:MAG: molecular chaperone [Alphaproteobacteria bacterium]|nr:molecular chaperone [Alphaproteobacteria bacterium]
MTRFGTGGSASDCRWICAAAVLLLAAAFWVGGVRVPGALAFSVSPTHIELVSVGRAGRSQIVVQNTESVSLPIEVTVDKFKLDENGRRKNVKAGEDFLVFPAQALIPAGGTQVFRLQWVGEPMLAESQSYIVNISQIPVRMPKGHSGLQVAVSFGALVNVAPPKSQAQLDLVATDIVTDQSGRRFPMVTVQNPSRTHALFTRSTLRLAGEGWDLTVPPGQLQQKVGIGLVQPGSRRKFVLPFPIPDNARRIRASLAFDPSRR